jgi:hypothetical protein
MSLMVILRHYGYERKKNLWTLKPDKNKLENQAWVIQLTLFILAQGLQHTRLLASAPKRGAHFIFLLFFFFF